MKVKTVNISEINENSVKTINVGVKDISIFNVEGVIYPVCFPVNMITYF